MTAAQGVRTDLLRAKKSVSRDFVEFKALFSPEEGRLGVVVTFIAIMELAKESLIEIVQNESFAPIHVRARAHAA